MRIFLKLLLLAALSLLLTYTFAQEFSVTTYKERAGLPNTVFKAVGKDSLGFVWIGSDAGLVRYDGQQFVHYTQKLPSKFIKYFLLTKDKRLLASTDRGIIEIEAQRDTAFIKTILKGGNEYKNDRVVYPKMLYEDKKGRLWIACESAIAMLQYNRVSYFHFKKKDNPNNYVHSFSITEDGNGNLIAFSQPGNIFRFNEEKKRFEEITEVNLQTTVESILLDKPGRIVTAGRNGVRILNMDKNGKVKSIERYSNYDVNQIHKVATNSYVLAVLRLGILRMELKDGEVNFRQIHTEGSAGINHMFLSEQGNIWLATDKGLDLLRPAFFSSRINGLDEFYAQTLAVLPGGNVYTSRGWTPFRLVESDSVPTFEVFSRGPNYGYIFSFTETDSFLVYSTGDARILFLKNNIEEHVITLSECGRPVAPVFSDSDQNVWACQSECAGISKITPDFKLQKYEKEKGLGNNIVGGLEDLNKQLYLFANGDKFVYRYEKESDIFVDISDTTGLRLQEPLHINDYTISESGIILLGTNQGIFKFIKEKFYKVPAGIYSNSNIRAIAIDRVKNIWAATDQGLIKIANGDVSLFQTHNGLKNSNITNRSVIIDKNDNVWVGTSIGLSVSKQNKEGTITPTPFVQSINVNGESYRDGEEILSGSYAEFKFASLAFPSENIMFQIRLEPSDRDWQPATKSNHFFIPRVSAGKYRLSVRAKQDGNYKWSETQFYNFSVVNPWYQQWWAWVVFVAIFILTVALLVRLYVYRLKQQKKHLQKLVDKRTEELVEKQGILHQQKEELQTQKDELIAKNDQISFQNEQIQSSIRYAKTIQGAILPIPKRLHLHFDTAVIFRPKDIVSGDFYWYTFEEEADKVFLSVIDCSGHGVPGAFMSMIAYSLLNEIVKVRKIYNPADILTDLNKRTIEALKQEFSDNNDGMDLVLTSIDNLPDGNKKVMFSGAKNKLYHFVAETQELKIYKGDRKSIGGFRHEKKSFQFSQQEIIVKPNDILYLLTDGIIDQHCSTRKRFGSQKLAQLLENVALKPLDAQISAIESALNDFMENEQQRDDITFLAVKF